MGGSPSFNTTEADCLLISFEKSTLGVSLPVREGKVAVAVDSIHLFLLLILLVFQLPLASFA